MPILLGLEGVSGELEVRLVRTAAAARRAFREGFRAVSAAGPHAAADVYRDDAGVWRGLVHQYLRTVEWRVFKSREAALRWYRAVLPRMGDFDTVAGSTAPEWKPVDA